MNRKSARRSLSRKTDPRTFEIGSAMSAEEAQDIVRAICADQVDALVVFDGGRERIYILREPSALGEETWETVRALRRGEIDAVVISGSKGEEVHLLKGADSPYRVIVQAMSEGAAILSADSSILQCNEAFASLIGKPALELVGTDLKSLLSPEYQPAYESLTRRSIQQTSRAEFHFHSNRGEDIPVAFSLTPITIENMLGSCLIVTDLRRVREAEDALRDSAEYNRQIVSSAREGIAVLDTSLRYQVWNRYMEEITGISAAQVVGRKPSDVFSIGGIEREDASRRALLGETTMTEVPFAIMGSDRIGITHSRYTPLRDDSGTITGVLTTIREVSEEKRKEKELRDTTEQLRKLTARLHAVRDEESTRIAREIHDQLGGLLTVLKLELAMMVQNEKDPIKQAVGKASDLVDQIGETVQSIALNLRPSTLDQFGLPATIRAELDRFAARTGVEWRMQCDDRTFAAPREIATSLYRIFEECITNVARHAKATRVEVILEQDKRTIRLQIRDNGRGFEAGARLPATSLGLVGIRERALNLGGVLSISSAPGEGTSVTVTVPLIH